MRIHLRSSLRTLAVLAVLASTGVAQAQEARRITFDEAVRIALDQNIALQQVENRTELQAINVSRARMNFFPDLSLDTRGGQSYGRSFSEIQGDIVEQTSEFMDFGVGSSVNLFNGFSDVATYKQAQLTEAAGDQDLDRARQTVVFNVMSGYLTLIERREQIRVHEENLAAVRQQLEQIEAFTQVGQRPISDLYQQQAEVASAELALLQAQQQYQIAESNLIQTLHLDPFQPYEFAVPSVDEVELTPESYNVGNMLRNAYENRADLRAGELSIQAARQGVTASRSTFWPRVGLNFGYGTNWNSLDQQFSFWDQLDTRRGGSVGLSLSLPIFDRFATRNNVQQARVQFENARLELEDLQQEIAVQVRQAYLDYETAQKSVQVAETQVQSAQLALEAAQERYAVGAATLVEVTQAQAAFVEAESARVQARYDFIFREKLIDYYLGVLNPQESLF